MVSAKVLAFKNYVSHLRQKWDWGPNDAVWISVTFRVHFGVAIGTHLGLEEVAVNHRRRKVA